MTPCYPLEVFSRSGVGPDVRWGPSRLESSQCLNTVVHALGAWLLGDLGHTTMKAETMGFWAPVQVNTSQGLCASCEPKKNDNLFSVLLQSLRVQSGRSKVGGFPNPHSQSTNRAPSHPCRFYFCCRHQQLDCQLSTTTTGPTLIQPPPPPPPLPPPPFPPLLFLGSRTAELSLTPGHPKHLAPPTTTTTASQHVTELCLASARPHKWPRSASRTRSPTGPSGDLFSHAQGTPPRAPAERALHPEGLTAASTTISGAPWPTTWPRT